jgi:AcrR family transcriptional regulator
VSRAATPFVESLRARLAELAAEVATFGPRSVPSPLRRDHVLTAATLAFVEAGFEAASMQRIAELAGVTKPAVYALFPSKEELFVAVVDRTSDEMAGRLQEATRGRGSQLGPGVRAYLEYLRFHRGLWGAMWESNRYGAIAGASGRMRDRQVEVIAASLARGYAELGVATERREVEALAHFVVGSVEAVGRWWLGNADIELDAVVDFLVDAVGPGLASVRSAGEAGARFGAGPGASPGRAPRL